jgi:mRNA interferase RelE/StbE
LSPLEIIWTDACVKDLRRLDRRIAERVRAAVRRYAETGQGDVKQLRGSGGDLRLRVGDWRVRFRLDFDTATMSVLRVLPRGRAYRR